MEVTHSAAPTALQVKKTRRCVVVHEATRTSGFGAELVALVQEHCFYHLEAPVARVAGWDEPLPHGAIGENLTIADLGNLWGVLGGRYVPSVLMRARMVVIDASQITQQIPAVTRPETGARPAGVV